MTQNNIIKDALKDLLLVIARLKKAYPKRSFTLDGVLLGDIGKTIAETHYDIEILKPKKMQHNAVLNYHSLIGTGVELRVTMKNQLPFMGVTPDRIPDYYLGIKIDENANCEEIYNGPGQLIYDQFVDLKKIDGYRHIPLNIVDLRKLNADKRAELKIRKKKIEPISN